MSSDAKSRCGCWNRRGWNGLPWSSGGASAAPDLHGARCTGGTLTDRASRFTRTRAPSHGTASRATATRALSEASFPSPFSPSTRPMSARTQRPGKKWCGSFERPRCPRPAARDPIQPPMLPSPRRWSPRSIARPRPGRIPAVSPPCIASTASNTPTPSVICWRSRSTATRCFPTMSRATASTTTRASSRSHRRCSSAIC